MRRAQGLVTQKALSLEMAQTIIRGPSNDAVLTGFSVSVTVVDGSGLLKAFLRDKVTGRTHRLEPRKAYTALTFASRFPTSLAFAAARVIRWVLRCQRRGNVGVGAACQSRSEMWPSAPRRECAGRRRQDEVCANAGIAEGRPPAEMSLSIPPVIRAKGALVLASHNVRL